MSKDKHPEEPLNLTDEQRARIIAASKRWGISPALCLDEIIKAWGNAYDSVIGTKKRRIPAE